MVSASSFGAVGNVSSASSAYQENHRTAENHREGGHHVGEWFLADPEALGMLSPAADVGAIVRSVKWPPLAWRLAEGSRGVYAARAGLLEHGQCTALIERAEAGLAAYCLAATPYERPAANHSPSITDALTDLKLCLGREVINRTHHSLRLPGSPLPLTAHPFSILLTRPSLRSHPQSPLALSLANLDARSSKRFWVCQASQQYAALVSPWLSAWVSPLAPTSSSDGVPRSRAPSAW